MGVTPERRSEWEDLCKVREHLTCLSMTPDHYQGNRSLHQFANKGWPHFTVMQSLIYKTTKGTHAYRGTQLGTQTPAPEPVISTPTPGPVVSTPTPGPVVSTPTPEPVISTPSSSKRVFSSLDDAIASSSTSSKKRARNTPSTSTALYGLQTTFQATLQDFATQVHGAFAQPLPQRVASQTPAIQRLLRSIASSTSSEGGAWLSHPEVLEVLNLFRDSSTVSTMYVTLAEAQEGEELSREWLRNQLEDARTARASAPGGSEAL